MELLTTKSSKKHSRICILMKMKVVVLLVTESETKVENGLMLLCELRVDLSLTHSLVYHLHLNNGL